MKVGDYVRTKYGISKIVSNPENHSFNIDIFKKDRITLRCIRKKDIIKSSPEIIDLIEVGDYVNGEEVKEKFNYLLGFECGQDGEYYRDEKDIKSIVTKEQFESMEYKIGE